MPTPNPWKDIPPELVGKWEYSSAWDVGWYIKCNGNIVTKNCSGEEVCAAICYAHNTQYLDKP
jgi:hypothetical protein